MVQVTIPSVRAQSFNMQLIRGDRAIERMDGSKVFWDPGIATWRVSFPIAPLNISEARAWQGALVQLCKLGNTFKLQPPDYSGPGSGYSGASPKVKDAGQTGTALGAYNVTASTTIAITGDFLEINGEFKVLTANATSSTAGEVIFNIEPKLKASPSTGSTIDIQTPQFTLHLADPIASWDVQLPRIYNFNVDAVESY